jgi:YebC/PmpR family DNA-binding regulatory protein
MVEGLTDNRNRTAPEIKKIFERRGGSLGAAGCVGWMFSKRGLITVKVSAIGEDDLMEIVLSAGAEDMQNLGEVYEITCTMAAYEGLKKILEEKKIPTESAQIAMIPQNKVPVNDLETAQKLLGLMEEIEDHDDVQEVYANFDISDEVLKQIGN